MRVIFLLMLLVSHVSAQLSAPRAIDGHVYDPEKWLDEDRRVEIEAMLEKAEEQWGSRLYAVVLEEVPPIGAEAYALKLGRLWGGDGVWGVLVHVPGEQGSPWCVAEQGAQVKWVTAEGLESAMGQAMERARREPIERLRLQVACRELTDELGFIAISSERMSKRVNEAREQAVDRAIGRFQNKRWIRRAIMLGVPFLLLVLAVTAVLIKRRWKERKKTFLFPETEQRRRFQGPWSGGGNVILRFTSKVGEDGSRRG